VPEYSVEVFRGRKGKTCRTHSMYVGRIRNMCITSIGISDWKTHFDGSRHRWDYTRTTLDLKVKVLLEFQLDFTTADHVRAKSKIMFIEFLKGVDGLTFH
jgi:hypothetical protein